MDIRDNYSIKVTKPEFLAAASLFTTKSNDINQRLSVVRIEPHPKEGISIIAIDNHRLIYFHDIAGGCKTPATIRVEGELLNTCKDSVKKKNDYNLYIKNPLDDYRQVSVYDSSNPDLEIFRDDKAENYMRTLETTYPDWSKLMYQHEYEGMWDLKPESLSYDSNLLKDYARMLKIAYGNRTNTDIKLVPLEVCKDHKEVTRTVISGDQKSWFSILMGVKVKAAKNQNYHLFLDKCLDRV